MRNLTRKSFLIGTGNLGLLLASKPAIAEAQQYTSYIEQFHFLRRGRHHVSRPNIPLDQPQQCIGLVLHRIERQASRRLYGGGCLPCTRFKSRSPEDTVQQHF